MIKLLKIVSPSTIIENIENSVNHPKTDSWKTYHSPLKARGKNFS